MTHAVGLYVFCFLRSFSWKFSWVNTIDDSSVRLTTSSYSIGQVRTTKTCNTSLTSTLDLRKTMKKAIAKFDDLSLEVLLDIFDYLPALDCFRAFSRLNGKIDSALKLTGLSIDLTLVSNRTFEEFYEDIIFAHHGRQIRALKVSNELTIDLLERIFRQYRLRDFKQLRSLTLIRPSYMTLGSLAFLVPQLRQLEHLSIDANTYPEEFFSQVTTKSSSLKSCHLPELEIEEELTAISSVEYLTVTVENITVLLNLLSVYPRLKHLNVFVKHSSLDEEGVLPETDRISVDHLRTLKLQILEQSHIELKEIDHCFQHITFKQLKSLSYVCTTDSMTHFDACHWKAIVSSFPRALQRFEYFVQIPYYCCDYADIDEKLGHLQENFSPSFEFSLSINHFYFIIHSDIYPKEHFDVSFQSSDFDCYENHDPLRCHDSRKYSKVRSLILNSHSISPCAILPNNVNRLHILGGKGDSCLPSCVKSVAHQLISLRVGGFPDDLPFMGKLQQLSIQQTPFELSMVSKLASQCPALQLLTIDINSLEKFKPILVALLGESHLLHLTFIRVFRSIQIWSSQSTWMGQRKNEFTNQKWDERVSLVFYSVDLSYVLYMQMTWDEK